jgi:hypothetical protein
MAFVFPDIEVPDVDLGALRALDSLRVPAPPPPVFFMGRDTLDLDAFRARMDSLRVAWPRGLELDSLERARMDSLERQVQRQVRLHREEVRRALRRSQRLDEALRDSLRQDGFSQRWVERQIQRADSLREELLQHQPERLREQAEALRRQAERLEEQAQEMERQAAPDTTGTSGVRRALPIDAAPLGMLRAGMHAHPGAMPPAWFTEPGPALAMSADRLREQAPSLRVMQRAAVRIHRLSDVYDLQVLSGSSL